MPFHKERYPENWKEISLRIRARAGGRCEFCGAENYRPHPITGPKVVLTVAYLDHNPQNCADDNLKALCQRCHLTYDAEHHARNAATTRHKRRLEAGQMELIKRGEETVTAETAGSNR
jgi:5-methylcytosine-specific restriction endonuclease McrA